MCVATDRRPIEKLPIGQKAAYLKIYPEQEPYLRILKGEAQEDGRYIRAHVVTVHPNLYWSDIKLKTRKWKKTGQY
jgi:hypothetical protein